MSGSNIVIDAEFAVPEYSDVCSFCRHALPAKRRCTAFKGEIPLEIWNGDNDHRSPFPGDNGIQFEPKKKE
jgi:hypothetical protein